MKPLWLLIIVWGLGSTEDSISVPGLRSEHQCQVLAGQILAKRGGGLFGADVHCIPYSETE